MIKFLKKPFKDNPNLVTMGFAIEYKGYCYGNWVHTQNTEEEIEKTDIVLRLEAENLLKLLKNKIVSYNKKEIYYPHFKCKSLPI